MSLNASIVPLVVTLFSTRYLRLKITIHMTVADEDSCCLQSFCRSLSSLVSRNLAANFE